jgi:hypothetical protein
MSIKYHFFSLFGTVAIAIVCNSACRTIAAPVGGLTGSFNCSFLYNFISLSSLIDNSQPVDGKLPLTAHQGSVSISLLEAAELATIKAEKETLERNYQMNHQHQAALHSSSAALSMIANAFSGNTKSTSSLQKQPVKQPAAAAASTVVDAKPVDSGALMSPSNAIKVRFQLS